MNSIFSDKFYKNEYCRPRNADDTGGFDATMPVLAPPPKSPEQNLFNDTSPRFNPFDQKNQVVADIPNQIGALPFGKNCVILL